MEKHTCSNLSCESDADKRCSRCQVTFYCSKNCQVTHWKTHKDSCMKLDQDKTVDKPYKCVQIPGKGLGMVATRDISYGELVIQEKPIVTTHDVIGSHGLARKLDQLSIEDKNKIMSLYDKSSPKSLMGVFETNSLQAGVESFDSVLCYEISRFNHSCVRNVDHAYVYPYERIHAVRDIKKGTELCTSYINPCLATRERQELLQQNFNFACTCVVCSLPAVEQVARDRKLRRYALLDQKIGSGNLDAAQGLGLVQEALDILAEVQLNVPALISRHCYDGFQLACLFGNERKAKSFIKRAYDAHLIKEGPDAETTKQWKEYLRNPRLHRAWKML